MALIAACATPGLETGKLSRFESPVWEIALSYPADWAASPGMGADAMVLTLRAPGAQGTAGSGVSVVAAYSAAPLKDLVATYEATLGPECGNAVARDGSLAQRPAKIVEYQRRGPGGAVAHTRTIITRADDRVFILTFSAYEPQLEYSRRFFTGIEESVEIQ